MTDLSQSVARMRQAASSLNTTRSQSRAAEAEAQTADADTAAQTVADIKDNPIYQIMSKKGLSKDEQINAIAKYLTVENEDYTAARKRFAEFQNYFNNEQSEGMRLDMRGLERLVKEVKDALKPEVEKIVNDVVAVQQGVDKSKELLEVMRTARLEGKTIDQIKTAIDLNDQILKAIEKTNQALGSLRENESYRQGILNEDLDRKLASEKGVWNSIKRKVAGPDKQIAADIEFAQARLQEVKTQIEEKQTQLKEKQDERNTQLESGPLMILRSIDATEDGFAKTILDTATRSLALITGASTSVQRLLKRMAYSKEQAMEISESISKAEIREAILEGAVKRVATVSHDQSEVIKTRLIAMDEKIGDTEDVVEKAALNAERVGAAELQKTALAYEEDVKRMHANFTMTSANSVEAHSRATSFHNLLLAQEDMLQQVAARTLPETARALRMGLEVNVGMQASELASSISAVTRKAIEIGKGNYKDLANTQNELRAADLKIMQDAIDALTTAQTNVVDAAEATVKHSNDRSGLTANLGNATKGLRELLEQFDDIRARAADPAPVIPGVVGSGDGPSRPLTAANDAGPVTAQAKKAAM